MKAAEKSRFFHLYVFIVAVAVAVALVAGFVVMSSRSGNPLAQPASRDVAKLREEIKKTKYDDRKAKVVEYVLPSVVVIRAKKPGEDVLGTGFIVDPRGYIVTSDHVISGAQTIEVTLYDKRKYAAQVQGIDEKTAIAVIKIDAPGLEFVTWGDSDAARIGDEVIAIGNPSGFLTHSVTNGIISQKGRNELGVIKPEAAGPFKVEDFIQTNALLLPGNSGGPLFNMEGDVIGVNTAVVEKTQFGLAVPSNIAKFAADRLIRDGKVVRGYLGVKTRDIDNELAAIRGEASLNDLLNSLGLNAPSGAYVDEVPLAAPAINADIRQGDVIVKIGGAAVPDGERLRMVVAELTPGITVDVEVIRNKKPLTLRATIAEQPSGEPAALR
jgi:serine protease Do